MNATTPTQTITLSRNEATDCWEATHSDPAVARLFGVATLPTAYRACMSAAAVLRAIRQLNPGCHVLFIDCDLQGHQ